MSRTRRPRRVRLGVDQVEEFPRVRAGIAVLERRDGQVEHAPAHSAVRAVGIDEISTGHDGLPVDDAWTPRQALPQWAYPCNLCRSVAIKSEAFVYYVPTIRGYTLER